MWGRSGVEKQTWNKNGKLTIWRCFAAGWWWGRVLGWRFTVFIAVFIHVWISDVFRFTIGFYSREGT